MPKINEITGLLITRIRNGTYALNQLPSGRRLAQEMGVSHMTARRALADLVTQGWLIKEANGRLKLNDAPHITTQMKLAFVSPSFASQGYFKWLEALKEVAKEFGGTVRHICYSNREDPVIYEVLGSDFDGIILIPPIDIPLVMLKQIRRQAGRVITLFHDLTDKGIPCLDGPSPEAVDMLIEHLYSLGHRRIDCINTQPMSKVLSDRIDQWWKSLKERNITGQLYNSPVNPFENSGLHARNFVTQLLNTNQLDTTAIFCVTLCCAQGTVRALADRGIVTGRDVSIVSFGENESAALMTPSLTVVKETDLKATLRLAFDWIRNGGKNHNLPLLMRLPDKALQIGESTKPPVKNI